MNDHDGKSSSVLGTSGVTKRHIFPTGTLLGGRYEVLRCLGSNMRGAVYLTADRALNHQPFAVKVLWFSSKQLDADPKILQRFQNEAEIAHRVRHPNVVAGYEYFAGDDYFAFSMDYVGGGTLRELMKSGRKLAESEIIGFLMQACSGLHAIHRVGTVHRDVKPENILLTKQGEIKLTDFGIARIADKKSVTAVGTLLGTMDYCSPEYLMENICDARSDIYALGTIAYELITGRKPYHSETLFGTVRERLNEDPPRPEDVTDRCSPELSRVIMKALCRDPEQRYQGAYEMYDDLDNLLAVLGEDAPPLMNHDGSKRQSAVKLQKKLQRKKQLRRQAIVRVTWFFGKMFLLTVGGILAFYFILQKVMTLL